MSGMIPLCDAETCVCSRVLTDGVYGRWRAV